ncbi:hypothetical protein [Burkholderia sp. L27(2015)]|uniref:hypothetical protein n=1 Tax=Burkholderia sp. L27(2015) TaxID=1641858 RepID=UPI00131C7E9B|nr:hypothetical protein [Burkholderia sp. L27(2015)]
MRSEANTPVQERTLIVEGRASRSALAILNAGLPKSRPIDSEILFISFAYADIPIGRKFTTLFPEKQPHLVTRTNCQVMAVTQQFAKPFDEIPHGWKTVCLVQFVGGVPDVVRSLPEVNGWYENRDTVCLCDEDTWLRHID